MLGISCTTQRNSASIAADDVLEPKHVETKSPASSLTVRPIHRPPRKRSAPRSWLGPVLTELREHDGVGGWAIGAGGSEAHVHRVVRELHPKGDLALAKWLADDDHPTVRAAGLWELAMYGEKNELVAHVCDRESLSVCPGGCLCHHESVGQIAQEFLWSPQWLGAFAADAGTASLLDPRESASLAFRIAATDGCDLGSRARATASSIGSSGWTWSSVRAAAPDVPSWMLVKALARIDPQRGTPLFVEVLADPSAPPRARLAAASALTLSTAAGAEPAIATHAAFLDGSRPGLSAELRDAIATVRKVKALSTNSSAAELIADAAAAGASKHRLVLHRLALFQYSVHDVRLRAEALTWVADHLASYEDCWNAYRATAYELEDLLDNEFARPRIEEALPGAKGKAFEEKVREATMRLDSDGACR
jgi:hypothetical protein